jgi:hypothetical protein
MVCWCGSEKLVFADQESNTLNRLPYQRAGEISDRVAWLAGLSQARQDEAQRRQGYEPQNGKQADLHESISMVGETVSYGPIQSGSKKLASV